MIPDAESALRDIALKVMFGIAPDTTSTYAAANAGMIAMLLQCLAQEYDRGADARLQDIAELNDLLAEAGVFLDAELAAKVEVFRNSQPASLRVSDITSLHAEGLTLLTAIHAKAEDAAASEFDAKAWQFLERMADRHAFDV